MPRWNQVTIIGVGLIGGSIGRALLARKLADRVVGCGRDETKLACAQSAGVITEFTTNIAEASQAADVIVICTPVEMVAEQVRQVAATCSETTLITDAGSIKGAIIDQLAETSQTITRFVGSHPLAGGEKAGAENSDADLFVDRVTMITPTATTLPDVTAAAHAFWQAIGSTTIDISPAEHDEAVASISHLPHMIASILAAAVEPDHLQYASTGFADTTRVAGGNVEIWRQILLGNRSGVLNALGNFERLLASMRKALQDSDSAAVAQILSQGKFNRDAVGSRNPTGGKPAEPKS